MIHPDYLQDPGMNHSVRRTHLTEALMRGHEERYYNDADFYHGVNLLVASTLALYEGLVEKSQ